MPATALNKTGGNMAYTLFVAKVPTGTKMLKRGTHVLYAQVTMRSARDWSWGQSQRTGFGVVNKSEGPRDVRPTSQIWTLCACDPSRPAANESTSGGSASQRRNFVTTLKLQTWPQGGVSSTGEEFRGIGAHAAATRSPPVARSCEARGTRHLSLQHLFFLPLQ